MKYKLSVVLATKNEEENIGDCLRAVKDIADEIIVVDEYSSDKTCEIARKYGAKVFESPHHKIFHFSKQKALDLAKGEWILQLDADERVTKSLASEIREIINLSDKEIDARLKSKFKSKKYRLFLKHQKLLEERDGPIGRESGGYAGFFIPRLNFFLGKYLRYGGVYPDGVIRLVKKGKAHFPCKSVHEQIVVNGRVGWLENDLLHLADKSFKRYLKRNSYYIDLIAREMGVKKVRKGLLGSFEYFLIKPIWWFCWTLFRHKGIFDGWQGIVFSFFSALRFPRAYFRHTFKG